MTSLEKNMLKIDLHLHPSEDPKDYYLIDYSAKELIDLAKKKKYDAIAITNHNAVTYNNELKEYADKKGIILIPGTEVNIGKQHVLVINVTSKEMKGVKTFDDLRQLKKKNKKCLIIAPHPYFLRDCCLGDNLVKNIDLFDAIEYSFFHTPLINLNKEGMKIAKKYDLPIVGNSDCHLVKYFGRAYSLVDAEKNIDSIIKAIKEKKVKHYSKGVSIIEMMKMSTTLFSKEILKKMKNVLKTKNR